MAQVYQHPVSGKVLIGSSKARSRRLPAALTAAVTFGQFTAVGAGAITTAEAPGIYGQFTVAAGKISPNVSPLTTGVATVGATTILVVPAEASVATVAEFSTARNAAPLGTARTIRFRAGSYTVGGNFLIASANYTARLTVTGEPGARLVGSVTLQNPKNVTITGLEVHDTSGDTTAIVIRLAGACTGCVVSNNWVHGVTRDPLGDFSAPGSYVNPDTAIGSANSGGWLDGCEITGNLIEHVQEGIVLHMQGGRDYLISDNYIRFTYSDAMKWVVDGTAALTANKTWARNIWDMQVGRQDDVGGAGPHSDFLQLVQTAVSANQNITNFRFVQNASVLTALSRGFNMQGLVSFDDGLGRSTFVNPVVTGNTIIGDSAHAINLKVDGGVFAHNTIVRVTAPTGGPPFGKTTGIARLTLAVVNNAAQIIRNVYDAVPATTGPATLTDNIVLGGNGATIPYASAFVGPTFSPPDWAATMAAFAIKPGGPLDLAFGRGAIGSAIGTYGAATSPSGWTYNAAFEATVPGVTQPLALTAMPFDGYVFDSANNVTAPVIIRGKGTTGQSIQARGESAGGNTAWVAATVDAFGNWSAQIDVPAAQWGNWYTPAARIGTNDATKLTHASAFGCGHVVGFLGQSEDVYVLSNQSFYRQITPPAIVAENAAVIVLQANVNSGALMPARLTAANVSAGKWNHGLIALANAAARAMPGRKFCFLDMAQAGTGPQTLMNDASTAFDWNTKLKPVIDKAREGGGEVGHVIYLWYNSPAATIKTFPTEWSPFFMGQRWAGGAFTVGTTNPDAVVTGGTTVDHILWDATAPSGQKGRGIFSTRTKLHVMTPMPFLDAMATEARNFSTEMGGGHSTLGRHFQLDRPARDKMKEFFDDARVQTFAGTFGPSAHMTKFGGGSSDIHPDVTDGLGQPQYAVNRLPVLMAAAGTPMPEPTITGVVMGPAGAWADVVVNLPNGGTLTTIRALRGTAAPGVEPVHYQPVMGFEIGRAADTDDERRPVFKTSQTTYPAAYRGTVTIVDAGTGVAPSRTGRVRITPTVAFAAGDKLDYLRGAAVAMILKSVDLPARPYENMLVEHLPALYFTADLYPFYGVPVRPQPPTQVLA